MWNHKNTLFGKYKIGKLLGCGAFAKVYHARCIGTGQSVAVKVIQKTKITNTSNIKKEIAIMSRLHHPHIVKLYEVLATKSKIYVVIEFVKGGELFAKVAKGRFDEDTARKYFQQLISAVGFCHSRGIYHRDLKPENLLIEKRKGEGKETHFLEKPDLQERVKGRRERREGKGREGDHVNSPYIQGMTGFNFIDMASVCSPQPPSSPASASNSEISSTQPPACPSTLQHQDAAIDYGVRDALDEKPILVDPFEDMNSEEYIERFNKYEADYTCRLMAKYFSDKDIYGGNVYEEKMTIDGETIKASRWHCAESYADPTQFLQQQQQQPSTCSSAPPKVDISNGKDPIKLEGQ